MNRTVLSSLTLLAVICSWQSAIAQTDGTIALSTDKIEVVVSLQMPRIIKYRLKATGGDTAGSVGGGGPQVVIIDPNGREHEIRWAELSPTVSHTQDSVVFTCTATVGGRTATVFDYAIRLESNVVTITTERIQEMNGCELLEFRFPADPLIRVAGDVPSARVCVGDLLGEPWRGGEKAEPGRIVKPGEKLGEQYHFGLVYNEKVAAGIWTNALYRKGTKPIRTTVGENWAGLYTNNHRYSYKDENYEPYVCKIGLVGDVSGDGAIDWKDAACFIHDSIPRRVKLNQDCVKYMLNHGVDFESAPESVLRKICNISDGHRQMVLLSGWNGWGWDSEYPTWNQPGEEFGGREGLYVLHENAHKYRAYTSIIHNFDDAYMRTRMWDESIISRNSDGSLVRGTWWSGGPSYIISAYRLWKTGKAKGTIDGLIAQGLEHQIFSDVFTILSYRGDQGPDGAGDEETNLVLGKFKILDYLAQHDIYMNSEGFNYEMLGRYIGAHNGYQAGISRDPNRPPLAFFICHGLLAKKVWGADSDEGRFRGEDTEVETPFKAGQVYRWAMLMEFYGDKPTRDFRVTDDGYYAKYGQDAEVNWNKTAGVTVALAGAKIADGKSVLLPKPELGPAMWDVLRAYTDSAEPMRYSKPAHWRDPNELTVMELTYDNPPKPVANDGVVQFAGDQLVIHIPQGHPYKLVYGRNHVEQETRFEPLPPRRPLTYPLDEVIGRQGADSRPPWIRLKTRRQMTPSEGVTLCVGCSAVWPTKEQATEHAAAIVSKKIAWFVRQNYVNRSRQYEQASGANTGSLGYDNWNLGYEAAVKMYTRESIQSNPDAQWYWERVLAGPNREPGWKAFVALPFRAEDGQAVYIQAAKDRLQQCREQLQQNLSTDRKSPLELNVRVYEKLLNEEPSKKPMPVKLQV